MLQRRENIIVIKTEKFADRIVKMCQFLEGERHISYSRLNQIYRSGTSIGANTAESQFAQSDADFVCKLSIALKEANETRFWIERLHTAGILTEEESSSHTNDCNEIIYILISIINKMKDKLKNR